MLVTDQVQYERWALPICYTVGYLMNIHENVLYTSNVCACGHDCGPISYRLSNKLINKNRFLANC